MSAALSPPTFSTWSDVVVIASGTSWDGVWLSEKHLARHLAPRMPVLFVDPPVSLLSPFRNAAAAGSLNGPRLRMVGDNIARLTPVALPGISRPLLRDAAAVAVRRAIRSAVTTMGVRVRALIAGSLDNVLMACSADIRVLYGTDDWATGGGLMGLSEGWLLARERDQLAKADHVIAISDTLAQRWESQARAISVIPNGCDTDLFATTEEVPAALDIELPKPIAGFVGHLSERIDLTMLEEVAATGHSLLMVGPRQATFGLDRIERLLARPNVQWLGPRPFNDLPAYMQAIKVGLTPYSRSAFNLSSYPLKTLEYLAAGRHVVASDLPAARGMPRDLVSLAAGPSEFASIVARQLREPDDEDLRVRRQKYASDHSWRAHADAVAEVLGIS